MGEMYPRFLMISLLEKNDGDPKVILSEKKEELHRVQSYPERDILLPLSSYHIMRICKIDKHALKKSHYILEAPLKEYFLPKGSTKGDSYVIPKMNTFKYTYLIKITIWFSTTIQYFYGSSQLC